MGDGDQVVSMSENGNTAMAVAIGRLQEGQNHILDAIKNLSDKVDANSSLVSEIAQRQAVTDQRVGHVESRLDKAEARKPPWTAIVAIILTAIIGAREFLGIP